MTHVCIYGRECWCGAPVETMELDRRSIVAGVGGKSGWPIESDAAGVNPKQVEEARAESERLGVPTEFKKNGCAVFTDARHRRRYLQAVGMFDRNSFC